MKKNFKTFKLLLIALMLMLSSGCVKYNMTMDIKKDKSMDFTMIAAFDESLSSSGEMDLSKSKDEIKNKNCSVSDYSESNMKGISVLCKFPNIDELSSEKEVKEANFDSVIEGKDSKLFTVKKGFFKNTYTFKLDSSSSTSDLLGDEDTDNSYDYREEDDYDFDDDDYDDYDYDDDDDYSFDDPDDYYDYYEENGDNADYDLDALKNMDLKFEVKLPYKAISSNATSKEDNEKHLTWNLMEMSQNSDNSNTIELTFALYNVSNIAIVAVIVVALIAAGVIFFMKNKKKNVTGVTSMNTNNNGMLGSTNAPQDVFGNNFPVNNNPGVTVMPTDAMANNMNTNVGINNETAVNNTVDTNTVMPSADVSTPVNNETESVSLSNIPDPVSDVPKSDENII